MRRHRYRQLLAIFIMGVLATTCCPFVAAQEEAGRSNPGLVELAREFDTWLAANQPVSTDAALRIVRPDDWEPDWSQTSLQQRKTEYRRFQGRFQLMNTLGFNTGDQIDRALLVARVERIHWQLEVLASPRRNPDFYLDQSLGTVYRLLVESPSPGPEVMNKVVRHLLRFPTIFNNAKLMLDRTVGTLAEMTVERIGDVDAAMTQLDESLRPFVTTELQSDFEQGIRAARQSLGSYQDWLTVSQPMFTESPAVAETRLRWYLGHVALISRSPDSILTDTDITLARVGAQLALAQHQLTESTAPRRLDNADRLVQMSAISQDEIRAFLESTALVSIPEQAPGLQVASLPATLTSIANMGEPLVFSVSAQQPGHRFLHSEAQSAGFLEKAAWLDPRLLLTWDGSPGRHEQHWRSARHPRVLRRQVTEPTLNCGIALYFHQQLAQAGLYSFKPASYRLALRHLALKAALAQTDIRIAREEWNIEEAVQFLVDNTDLEAPTALAEVRKVIALPGAASAEFAAYSQSVSFVADAARLLGDEFSLQAFNDRLLMNAHVPVALQRWEYLGIEDELDQLIEQRGAPATVPQ